MPIFGHELALLYRLELTGDIANPVLFVGYPFTMTKKYTGTIYAAHQFKIENKLNLNYISY